MKLTYLLVGIWAIGCVCGWWARTFEDHRRPKPQPFSPETHAVQIPDERVTITVRSERTPADARLELMVNKNYQAHVFAVDDRYNMLMTVQMMPRDTQP